MESMPRGVGIQGSCMKINMEEVSLQRKTRDAYLTSSNRTYSTLPHEIQYECRALKRPHVSRQDALGLFLQGLSPLPLSGVLPPFLKASLFCSMPHLTGRTLLHLSPSDFTQSPGDFTKPVPCLSPKLKSSFLPSLFLKSELPRLRNPTRELQCPW